MGCTLFFICIFVCTIRINPYKSLIYRGFLKYLAERQGFEPREPLGSTVFKTAAIDHSAIFP